MEFDVCVVALAFSRSFLGGLSFSGSGGGWGQIYDDGGQEGGRGWAVENWILPASEPNLFYCSRALKQSSRSEREGTEGYLMSFTYV